MVIITPGFYPAIHKTLYGLVDTIKKLNITSAFYPQKITVDSENKTIIVSGVKKEFTNTTLVEDGQKQYSIQYVIVNGRFYIDDIKELKD